MLCHANTFPMKIKLQGHEITKYIKNPHDWRIVGGN